MAEEKENPIDPEKIAENPGILPYAHHVGSVPIKPTDKGKIKGRAMSAMYQQTDRQLKQIYEQIKTLAEQAKQLQERKDTSERIYEAEMPFDPIIGEVYHVYETKDGDQVVSLVSPEEWGPNPPYTFLQSVILLADHTWEIVG